MRVVVEGGVKLEMTIGSSRNGEWYPGREEIPKLVSAASSVYGFGLVEDDSPRRYHKLVGGTALAAPSPRTAIARAIDELVK